MAQRHQLTVMDGTGDSPVTYDPADVASTADVQQRFGELLAGGYAAFVIEQEGGDAIPTRSFQPDAHEHVLFPWGAGG
jgi:hypothetical protein